MNRNQIPFRPTEPGPGPNRQNGDLQPPPVEPGAILTLPAGTWMPDTPIAIQVTSIRDSHLHRDHHGRLVRIIGRVIDHDGHLGTTARILVSRRQVDPGR